MPDGVLGRRHAGSIALSGSGVRRRADGTVDLDGSRGQLRGANAQLGDVQAVDPFWYERKDVTFSPAHADYNAQLRGQLGHLEQ